MMGCGSLTSLSKPQTVNTHLVVDNYLLQYCDILPYLDSGKLSDRLYLSKNVIEMYGDCRRKQKALVDSVKMFNSKGN